MTTKKNLIAVDPGDKAGVAVFTKGKLSQVELVVGAVHRGWKWYGPLGWPVVCEIPHQQRGSPAKVDDLITLAFSAGFVVSQLYPSEIKFVLPYEWKGQRPKEVDNKYTMRLLSDQERQIAEASDIPASQRHNVIDAVGIGLWALKRR